MPLHSSPATRWLAVAAVTAATSLGAGCDADRPDGPDRPRGSRHVVPKGEQPVRAPGSRDRVRLGRPVPPSPFEAPVPRPNLLMITVDDAANGDLRHMPHVRGLLQDEGVTLTNGLAPTPICVPARASLITGQYAANHGARTISGTGGGFEAFEDDGTLPVWLQDAGYDTLFLGKYLNGYDDDAAAGYVPPGWTDWRGMVDPTTYNFVEPTVNDNGTERTYQQYSTDLLRDQTVEMLEDPQRQQDPWYLWVNYVAPHHGGPDAPDDPVNTHPDDERPLKTTTPAEQDENSFADLPLPETPNMFEDDTSDKGIVGATHRSWPPDRKEQLVEAHQQRVESLQAVDRAIAETVRTLQVTGQLDETFVVFTSDNGFVLGEHNLDGKLWYFREILGVPMIVRGPGLPRGERVAAPVTNADWAPTFAALAGATPTRELDGVDVMPWLATGARTRVVPIAAWPVKGGNRPLYTGVTVGDWTYVAARGGREELYYREVDPFENSNLRHDHRYRGQLRAMRRLADRYADCAGSSCPRDFYR